MGNEWRQEERLFLNHHNGRRSHGSGRRYFSRGGVKYALLELLEKEPMHGYQMMKALEDSSCGTYKPSPGSIYPTLQMLKDQGFIDSLRLDGKKVFTITDEGRAFLLEEKESANRDANDSDSQTASHSSEAYTGEDSGQEPERKNRRLTPAGRELLHLLKAAERAAIEDATKAVQLRFIINQLQHSLQQLIGNEASKKEDDEE